MGMGRGDQRGRKRLVQEREQRPEERALGGDSSEEETSSRIER